MTGKRRAQKRQLCCLILECVCVRVFFLFPDGEKSVSIFFPQDYEDILNSTRHYNGMVPIASTGSCLPVNPEVLEGNGRD